MLATTPPDDETGASTRPLGGALFRLGRARWILAAAGLLLSTGAPLGLRAFLAWAPQFSVERTAHELTMVYVTVATAVAFGMFGYSAGVLVDALEEARRALSKEATHDPLTGLLNRRAFHARLDEALLRSERTHEPVALIMLDVDHFKRVNDEHGHPTGDMVLRAMAQHIRSACRAIDAPARYGGEEFAVIAPGLGHAAATQVAERIRASVERAVTTVGGVDVRVTVSAGVAVAAAEGTSSRLVDEADAMLLRAKGQGRNQVCSCTDVSTEQAT